MVLLGELMLKVICYSLGLKHAKFASQKRFKGLPGVAGAMVMDGTLNRS